jgi:hypothetical protein
MQCGRSCRSRLHGRTPCECTFFVSHFFHPHAGTDVFFERAKFFVPFWSASTFAPRIFELVSGAGSALHASVLKPSHLARPCCCSFRYGALQQRLSIPRTTVETAPGFSLDWCLALRCVGAGSAYARGKTLKQNLRYVGHLAVHEAALIPLSFAALLQC